MPGKVGVKIKSGRNLPVMDKSSDTTDAYVEIKLGSVTYKTDVCRKSLNPQWNSDWFRFEVEDAELQDEPLQIRLMDHDTYSANDAIGKINISLNPLCWESREKVSVLSGWIPVFDTMHGIRGEVYVIVKVDLFSDVNKFRQSSCGIPFFHSQCVPFGYRMQIIYGFVEELIINDDPEYQWIDKIRTPRASNEARQVVFLKLSGQIQRKMGLKAINMGANAVIGYSQCFDLEGDVGVVARGIGTAVYLIRDTSQTISIENVSIEESVNEEIGCFHIKGVENYHKMSHTTNSTVIPTTFTYANSVINVSPKYVQAESQSPTISTQVQFDSLSSATTTSTATTVVNKDIGDICRRSSDSDLSITPRQGHPSFLANAQLMSATSFMKFGQLGLGKNINNDVLEMLEYPFLTMTKYPDEFIVYLGAAVAARSVKLLERVPNPDEPEMRDSWWTEIRMEIRSHARSLGCNVVLGYTESTAISEDICVLSATGTAAIINVGLNRSVSQNDIHCTSTMASAYGQNAVDLCNTRIKATGISTNESTWQKCGVSNMAIKGLCTICHIPYTTTSLPFNVKMRNCSVCGSGRVPDVLLATLQVPNSLQVTGRGCFLQAQVVRAKKDLRSELNAKEISDSLPFLEYELHRVFINKLKTKGMNAVFGLKIEVSIGERTIALIATGTGLFLSALPVPQVPKIVGGNSWTDKQRLNEFQKKLQDAFHRNQEAFKVKSCCETYCSDTDKSDEEVYEVDLNCGNKDTCVLEVDDVEDLELLSLLMEPYPPDEFYVVNTENLPEMSDMRIVKNLQMFIHVWRAKLEVGQMLTAFQQHFQRLLQTLFFKLRTMTPCAICDLRFKLDFPEYDQIQILIVGMALKLEESSKIKHKHDVLRTFSHETVNSMSNICNNTFGSKEEGIYRLDEDYKTDMINLCSNRIINSCGYKHRKISPRIKKPERVGIDICPLTSIPGGKIEKYLGNLDFFFIRESTSIRENGGICSFVHSFITELLAVVRAHIAALGGNALVSFYLKELITVDNQHKNQGQCIVSVGGDVVYVSYS